MLITLLNVQKANFLRLLSKRSLCTLVATYQHFREICFNILDPEDRQQVTLTHWYSLPDYMAVYLRRQ